ncbi:MAG TPA: SurA N-terminal domain-containing protein [bacterium]
MSRPGRRRGARAPAWAAVLALAWASAASAETVNRIVAVVNDDVITQADLDTRLRSLTDRDDAAWSPEEAPEGVKQSVLQRLIEERLLLQEARGLGVTVDPEELNAHVRRFRAGFGSEEAFRSALAASGMTEGDVREDIRERLLLREVIDRQVRGAIRVSPQEIAQELAARDVQRRPEQRASVSHLLIRVTAERTEEQARLIVDAAREDLESGVPLAEVASRFGDGPEGAAAGGGLGWVVRGQLLPELDAEAFSLEAGRWSRPIRTRLGYHLIRVEERADIPPPTDEELRRQSHQELFERKFREDMDRWLARLKSKAYIKTTAGQ